MVFVEHKGDGFCNGESIRNFLSNFFLDILGESAQHKLLSGRRTVGTAVALGVERWRHLSSVFTVGAAVV